MKNLAYKIEPKINRKEVLRKKDLEKKKKIKEVQGLVEAIDFLEYEKKLISFSEKEDWFNSINFEDKEDCFEKAELVLEATLYSGDEGKRKFYNLLSEFGEGENHTKVGIFLDNLLTIFIRRLRLKSENVNWRMLFGKTDYFSLNPFLPKFLKNRENISFLDLPIELNKLTFLIGKDFRGNKDKEAAALKLLNFLGEFLERDDDFKILSKYSKKKEQVSEDVLLCLKESSVDVNYEIFKKVKKLDSKDKIKVLEEYVISLGAANVLNNIEDFSLTIQEEESLMNIIAQNDPEVLLHNHKKIKFQEYKRPLRIFKRCIVFRADLMVYYLPKLNISQQDKNKLLRFFSQKKPLDYLKYYKDLFPKAKTISEEEEQFFKSLFLENLEEDNVEILNELADVYVPDNFEVNELIHNLKKEALLYISQDLVKKLPKKVEDKQKGSFKNTIKSYLEEIGLKKYFVDVICLVCILEKKQKKVGEEVDSVNDDLSWVSENLLNDLSDIDEFIVKNNTDEKNKFSNMGRRVLIEYVLENLGSQFDFVDLDWFLNKVILISHDASDENLNVFYEKVFKKLIDFYQGYWFEASSEIIKLNIPVKNKRALFEFFIEADPEQIVDQRMDKVLSDDQKIRTFNNYAKKDPWYLCKQFKDFTFKNKFQKKLLVKGWREQDIVPFVWFNNVSQALKILSFQHIVGIWNKKEEQEFKQAVSHVLNLQAKLSPKHWRNLQDLSRGVKFDAYDSKVVLLDYSVEGLELVKKLQDEYAYLIKDSDGKVEWSICLAEYLTKQNFKDFLEIFNGAKKSIIGFAKEERLETGINKKLEYNFKKYIPSIFNCIKQNVSFSYFYKVLEKISSDLNSGLSIFELSGFFDKGSYRDKRNLLLNKKQQARIERCLDFFKLKDFDKPQTQLFSLTVKEIEAFLNLNWKKLCLEHDRGKVFNLLMKFRYAGFLRFDRKKELVVFKKYLEAFGLLYSIILYKEYRNILLGREVSQDLKDLGVKPKKNKDLKKQKNVLLQKFRKLVKNVRDDFIMEADFKFADKFENPIILELINYFSNFTNSEWRQSKSFQDVIKDFLQAKVKGEIKPLKPEFTAEKIKVTKKAKVRLSEGVSDEYSNFVIIPFGNLKSSKGFERGYKKRLLVGLQTDLDYLLHYNGEDYFTVNLKNLISKLRKAEDIVVIVKELLDFRLNNDIVKLESNIDNFIRDYIIVYAAKVGQVSDQLFADFTSQEVTYKNIFKYQEFVANNLKQHVFPMFELSGRELVRLDEIFSSTLFYQEMERFNQAKSKRQEDYLCLPTRGVLGELSGYYCDACWTQQDEIMKNNPNMTAIAFIRKSEDKKNRTLIGGCLLIETTVKGEKALIIRGLNPRENYIINLNPESFVESFIDDYLTPICKKLGVKKIIAPVKYTGALSNRESSINEYFLSNYGESLEVELDEEVDFNNYNLKNKCVVIREL